MTESQSPPPTSPTQTHLQIPIEIVSEEEMALIEAALAAARSSLTSSSSISATISSPSSLSSSSSSSLFCPTRFEGNARRSIQSITLLSKRRLSSSSPGDIEDAGGGTQKKRNRVVTTESFLRRFRRNRGLSVTDITSTEWCEKQMEFILLFGKPEANKAMKAGIARHAVLEEEIVKRVKVRIKTVEDIWATKLMNFVTGVNQLMFDGLTRELPIVGFVEGIWMVGVIDEIRMPITETEKNPTLVDVKTRAQATMPSEPQRRNGMLQLMCYKYLWDNLVADKFPSRQFFDHFSLNRNCILSEEIRENSVKSGFPAESLQTLDDLVRYFQNTCSILPPAHDQLLLKYELQEDQSLLSEDQFTYDPDWLKGQIQGAIEFWRGEREAKYASEDERWKCKFCKFAPVCPINANSITKPS